MFNKQVGACCLSMVLACATHASEFVVTAELDIEAVDNPTNESENELKIKENQSTASVVLDGELIGRYARFISDASYEVRRYSKQKDQNHDLFLGSAELELGEDGGRVFGRVAHSAQEQLILLSLGDTPDNLDRRRITSATLGARLGRRGANRFTVYANLAEMRLDTTTENDSSRAGGGLSYSRQVSPLSTFGVELSGYTLDYINTDDPSFDYRRASLSWNTELRKLNYAIQVGQNSIGSEEDDSAPYYDLSLEYDNSVHQVSMLFRQWLTDTSQGSENGDLGDVSGPDGRLGVNDQYKRRDASVEWKFSSLCGRCTTALGIGAEREDYRRETQLDSQESFAQVQLSYKARRTLSVDLSYEYRDVSFLLDTDDYDQISARAGLAWSEVFKHGRLMFYVERKERKAAALTGSYDQGFIGVSFDYQLYRR
ncbi:hypothetical protein [Marinagarivorans cellulosilyticus]|uniref:Uncharacterized protein n=1 Tax=Marinagarivorans cellulosilyticus TaxID=2721545 RepID=A0AAN1WI61_9GAMM|nr:hypothetical protein [Marinagarivorans cellulosilyticus]BCD98063.1 hypothetical protein MARGE09_P2264 [Marinagarivorans cellulosilyticus]